MPKHSPSPLPDVVNIVLNKRGTAWHCLMLDSRGNVVQNAAARNPKAMRYVFEDLRDSFGQVPDKPAEEADGAAAAANSAAARPEGGADSIAGFWKAYLQYLRASGKAESTIRTYQLAYNEVVRKNRITGIDDLTLDRIEAWARNTVASGLRARSVNSYVRNIKAALEWGVDNFRLRRNPLEAWEPADEKEPVGRRDLAPGELRAVLEAEPDEEWRLRWLVYLYSGFRNRAEGALRWEWIDWEKREIAFPPGKNAKNARLRRIPVLPELYAALSAWRERKRARRENARYGPVLRSLIPRTIGLRLKEMCRKAGIDPGEVNLFSIRHTYEKALREEKRRSG